MCPSVQLKWCVYAIFLGEKSTNDTLYLLDIRTLDIVEGHMSNLGTVEK